MWENVSEIVILLRDMYLNITERGSLEYRDIIRSFIKIYYVEFYCHDHHSYIQV